MNSREEEAITRLEAAIQTWWAMQGEDIDFPTEGRTIADRIDACTAEVEAAIGA